MAKTRMGPGGGQMPTRSDEKMSAERFVFSYLGYSDEDNPKHHNTLKRLLKRTARKKRRQRDKEF